MKIFKEIINIILRFGTFALGWAIADLFTGDYKSAAWILFATSILFLIGYFTERFSEGE